MSERTYYSEDYDGPEVSPPPMYKGTANDVGFDSWVDASHDVIDRKNIFSDELVRYHSQLLFYYGWLENQQKRRK